jgi:AcrR family transcriptional regulator
MSPDDRRRAILEAVIPLLAEHGSTVTTRQMAEAAGVAEGTIFNVFPDKCALMYEAVKVTMDPAPVKRELAAIDHETTFDEQLRTATGIMLRRLENVMALMAVMRTMPDGRRPAGPPPFVAEANAVIVTALTELFKRHRSVLRFTPARAAVAFRGLIYATGYLAMSGADRLTVDEIVGVLQSGIVRQGEAS